MKSLLSMACVLLSCCSFAQLDIPTRVTLDSPQSSDRQVSGLASPISQDAGVSLSAARTLSTTYAVATGNSLLTASLTPTLEAYEIGMIATLIPMMVNNSNAQLNIDQLGAIPIHGPDGTPIDSARIMPDVPARFVFNGSAFVLLNPALLGCPTGYFALSVDACIEAQSHDTIPFYQAVLACSAGGARLCTFGEWVAACRKDPNFMLSVPEMEWVDSAGNHAGNAKTVGDGYDGQTLIPGAGCNYGAHLPYQSSARYRCCSDR